MLDSRFYELRGPISAQDLAARLGLSVARGPAHRQIVSVAAASAAGNEDLTFVDAGDAEALKGLQAGACIVGPDRIDLLPADVAAILAPSPRYAFARLAPMVAVMRELAAPDTGVSDRALIHDTVQIGPGAIIGPGAVLGRDVRVGPRAIIYPGVQIGARCSIGANAVVRCALLGDDVTLLTGSVIGEAGFGLAAGPGGPILTPHFGRVILQDRVSVGANSTVDRGLFDDTILGEASHIDNLCHIGHNCRIGRNVAMAAFAGISGSVTIGDNALLGGRVGIADHVTIGEGVRLGGGSAVLRDIPAGEIYNGYPAKPFKAWVREQLWLDREAQKRPGKKS